MSDRETFLYVLSNMPLRRTSAVVVLCGEDAESRLLTGLQLFRQGGAPVLLLAGGRHDPPRHLSAAHLVPVALAAGIAPAAVLTEGESRNTKEQALNVVARARAEGWTSLAVVASNYHLPRAFLTFVKIAGDLLLLPVPAHGPWWKIVPGTDRTRLDLLHVDLSKLAVYGDDVATPAEGLAHLQRWERTP